MTKIALIASLLIIQSSFCNNSSTMSSWQNEQRHYLRTDTTFVKRELRQHEKVRDIYGKLIENPSTRERLQNEVKALRFISSNTSIPVPEVLDFYIDNGAYVLVTKRVFGETLDNIEPHDKAEAVENVDKFLQQIVLPQLQELRSSRLGSLVGPVIPPLRVTDRDKRPFWPSKVAASDEYVFCHNDLAQHNIMVDPKTLQPLAILDWEYSGFYPPGFESYLWYRPYNEQVVDEQHTSHLLKLLRGEE